MEDSVSKTSEIHMQMRKWLAQRFSPVAAVFSSQTTKDFIKSNASLTPAELLRPFSDVGSLNNITINTVERNQPYKLKNFKIDFIDAHKIDGQSVSDQGMVIDYIIQS